MNAVVIPFPSSRRQVARALVLDALGVGSEVPELILADIRKHKQRRRVRELSAALARWKQAEKHARDSLSMADWEAENAAYCEMVSAAMENGYRPNTTETCAQWVRREVGE